jgi:hypothetical protein
MTDKAAAIPKDSGLMIVAEDKKSLDKFMGVAARTLGQQAMAVSRHTGLSLDFCSAIALHRAMRRMQG